MKEYEVVGYCKCGKPIMAPAVWSSKKYPRPHYPTCVCKKK